HAPLIFVDNELRGQGALNDYPVILPPADYSTLTVRVELPRGAASKTYVFEITRTGGGASLTLIQGPDKTVYQAGDTLVPAGLVVRYAPVSGAPYDVTGDCVPICDFTRPGPTFVFVTYIDGTGTSLYTAFPAWVVGLGSLTVTGPDGYAPALDLDDFSFSSYDGLTHTSVYDLDLGTVPGAVDKLYITAASAVVDASLTITPPPAGNPQAVSLNPGPNTITIKVRLDKRGHSTNIEERTYTLTVYRTPDLYVSGAGASGPAGNDSTGDGSLGKPYATIQKALEKAKTLPLDGSAELTIIVSGTITAVSGVVTNDGMVDISGTGYPHIILKGAPGGGTIDALGKNKRVLYIGDGNTVSLGNNLTLTRGNGGVFVASGGTFTMEGGAIEDNTVSGDSGGGVYVAGGGTFTMKSGDLQDNKATSGSGGGVYIFTTGTFTMTGGNLQGNTASGSAGGVMALNGGKFTMTGGVIQNNTATAYGGGVVVSGSGSTFTKTGGTIAGNPAVLPLLSNNAPSGYAVYLNGGGKRNATAGPAVTLYAKYDGGWIYAGGPGIGDTTGNWQ
ncbi:MAG: cadherin-like beta sandwich domain-containing protein, partial [Spirochaetaceae bacterium]|nr:cadherin-like beta sandwich domain-containing protein [Spirochaetaceae bacterium]